MTLSQKMPNLAKQIAAVGFKKSSKFKKIAQSGYTGLGSSTVFRERRWQRFLFSVGIMTVIMTKAG